MQLTLEQIFNKILGGDVIELDLNQGEFNTLRSGLLRKFKKHLDLIESIGGISPYAGQYLQARFDATLGKATIKLAGETEKVQKRKTYKLSDL